MKFIATAIAGLAILAAPAMMTPASAQTAQEVLPLTTDSIEKARTWKKWQILRNKTRNHCLGTKSDESGVMQIGMTADETMGYVGVFVKDWDPSSSPQEVVIKVGDQLFTGTTSGAVGGLAGDWEGGYVLANNQNFRKALESNNSMTVYPDQPWAIELNIQGTDAAIFEIIKCSQNMSS